jgi:hypothetical protein
VGVVGKSRRGVMLVEKQEWFVRLIAQGVSKSEACRIVGSQPQDGNTLALRAHNPQHCSGSRCTIRR